MYLYEDENGVPIYAGRGRGERMQGHLRIARNRKKPHPFYNKLKKMFRNELTPYFYKVKQNLTVEEANQFEIELIKKIGRKDLGKGSLLNLSDGGEGLLNMSEKHKDTIRKTHTGKINSPETIQKMSDSKKGIHPTEQHKENIRKALLGKKLSAAVIEKRQNLRWISNEKESKQVHKDKIEEYLKNGWVLGRRDFMTIEIQNRMSTSAKNRLHVS